MEVTPHGEHFFWDQEERFWCRSSYADRTIYRMFSCSQPLFVRVNRTGECLGRSVNMSDNIYVTVIRGIREGSNENWQEGKSK